jgi:uncharacterized membrane protein YccC
MGNSTVLTPQDKAKSWYSSLKAPARSTLQLDLSQLTTIQAIRAALGLGIPLLVGIITNNLVVGVSLAGGAASLAGVGLQVTYHSRLRLMLLACVGIALSAFVGSVTSPVGWLAVLVAALWGGLAGLLVGFGQSGLVIGLQLSLAMIILSHFALEPVNAALQAALMFGGALFQTALAMLPLPLRRSAAERMVLANLYRQLAAYARTKEEQNKPPVREALYKANTVLAGVRQSSSQSKIFLALLEEAERLRLSLLILNTLRQNLNATLTNETSFNQKLEALFEAFGNRLELIADELKITTVLNRKNQPKLPVKSALAELRNLNFPPGAEATLRQIVVYSGTLRNQLHTAGKLAKAWKYPTQKVPYDLHLPSNHMLRPGEIWTTLASNFTLKSPVFRHALRLGLALGLATALYRLVPLPLERGYWIPLTVLLVLRPDFKATLSRGLARMLGTILGAALTGLLLVWLAPSTGWLAILTIVMAYLAFSVLFVNYALFSVFITAEVVFLLTLVTPLPLETVAYRTLDTLVGGVLALIIYLLWPTWEHLQLSDNLANSLNKMCNYFDAIIEAYANPGSYDAANVQKLRQASRLAYTNASASVERSQQEPNHGRMNPELGQGLLDVRDKFIQSVLTLEAYLVNNPDHPPLPQAADFGKKVDEALSWCAQTLQKQDRLAAPPDLHNTLRALDQPIKTDEAGNEAATEMQQLLLSEAKRIVGYLKAMQQLVADTLKASTPRRAEPHREENKVI